MKIGDGVMELMFTEEAIGLHLLPDITDGYPAIGETQEGAGYGSPDIGGKYSNIYWWLKGFAY